jgi:hypothetical protein
MKIYRYFLLVFVLIAACQQNTEPTSVAIEAVATADSPTLAPTEPTPSRLNYLHIVNPAV